MILSFNQIEEIAVAVTVDYNTFFRKQLTETWETPIEDIATDYLGMNVGYELLSSDGSICGVTAYEDTELILNNQDEIRIIPLKRNQILLDKSLIRPGRERQLRGRRRFTLAHECAHQILHRYGADEGTSSYRRKYVACGIVRKQNYWNNDVLDEWQADELAAALLMPWHTLENIMWPVGKEKNLVSYGGRFSYSDNLIIRRICHHLQVSRTAAIIRLEQLGYIDERPYNEFVSPLEVVA